MAHIKGRPHRGLTKDEEAKDQRSPSLPPLSDKNASWSAQVPLFQSKEKRSDWIRRERAAGWRPGMGMEASKKAKRIKPQEKDTGSLINSGRSKPSPKALRIEKLMERLGG